jgi:hypothetical protein
MAKYMQDSTDIQINEISGTDNINFSFKSGNSIDTKIGDLTQLNTTNKSSIVGAINEARLEEYSTTEKIIGKWIDGKPLYRKTITFTSTIKTNETTSIAHNIENAKNIFIDFGASFMEANIGSSDYLSYNFPLIGYVGNLTDKVYCYVNPTNINFYANGAWGNNWTKHITLKYTKTTD